MEIGNKLVVSKGKGAGDELGDWGGHIHPTVYGRRLLLLLLLLSRCGCVRLCGPHRQQPTRLPGPWDSPGKNTGVGCHFLLQCMKVK